MQIKSLYSLPLHAVMKFNSNYNAHKYQYNIVGNIDNH